MAKGGNGNGNGGKPTAVADDAAVAEDLVLNAAGNVLANDTGNNIAVTNAGTYLGTYGTLVLNADGTYTYTLNNGSAAVQSLAAGDVVSEVFSYSIGNGNGSGHGASSGSTLTIDITGTNDAATISGTDTGSVKEDTPGQISTGGALTVDDVDHGQNHLQTPASLAGNYGNFALDSMTGAWTYTLDHDLADTLSEGQISHETLAVVSADGTATRTVDVTVTGKNDAPTIASDSFGSDALAAWTFEGSGADITGHGHDLGLCGGATFAGGGLFGQALSLDGVQGSYAREVANSSAFDFGSSDFTVQLWVNFDNLTNGREETLIEDFSGQAGPGWTLTLPPDLFGFYSAASGATPPAINFSVPASIPNGVWQQFIVERSGSTFNLFWDGNLVATATGTDPLPASPNPLLIGARDAADGRNFTVDGRIDNVAIWDHALSPAEVAQIWNNGAGVNFGNGTIFESADNSPAENTSDHLASGTIAFADVDLADQHTVSVTPTSSGFLGTLTANIDQDSTGTGIGAVVWTFAVADADLNHLQTGQSLIQGYDVTVDDGHGGTAMQTVSVTLVGTNDAPVIQPLDETEVTVGSTTGYDFSNLSLYQPIDINNVGQIVGNYSANSGFIYDVDTAATVILNDPLATIATQAYGINDVGQVVGYYYNGGPYNHAFLYDIGTNTYTTIDDPLGLGSNAFGINNAGHIVGTYADGVTSHGFIDIGGVYTTLDDPSGVHGTIATGINESDDIVGIYFDSNSISHGFLYHNGIFTNLDNPLATGGTYVEGINDAGQISGYYWDGSGDAHAFLYSDGTYATLDNPLSGTGWTFAMGINNAGQIVGNDGSGTSGSFVADPTMESTTVNATSIIEDNPSVSTLTSDGTLSFEDPDLLDLHALTVAGALGNLGTLTATVTQDTTGVGTNGLISWSYEVAESAVHDLDTPAVDTFDLTLDDGHGGTAVQTINIALLPPEWHIV